MHTFKYISIYSSFIISAFNTGDGFFFVTVYLTPPYTNTFVNHFYQAPGINPDDVTKKYLGMHEL